MGEKPMKMNRDAEGAGRNRGFDGRLAAYLAAAGAVGASVASEAQALVVSDFTLQPFGINGAVPIDFNGDGQTDFEIDHDRIDLGGGNIVDYLQLDKNDTNGAPGGENPLPINVFDTFDPAGNPTNSTFDAAYVTPTFTIGDYPAALSAGTLIGPASSFGFEETDNFQGSGKTMRANRLIDEDATQVDQMIGGLSPGQVQIPSNGPNFIGLGGEVGYLGVKMNLQNTGVTYGWIGIRITNEADATGEVVGWGYETSGEAINAGVPEPGMVLPAVIAGCFLWQRTFGRKNTV